MTPCRIAGNQVSDRNSGLAVKGRKRHGLLAYDRIGPGAFLPTGSKFNCRAVVVCKEGQMRVRRIARLADIFEVATKYRRPARRKFTPHHRSTCAPAIAGPTQGTLGYQSPWNAVFVAMWRVGNRHTLREIAAFLPQEPIAHKHMQVPHLPDSEALPRYNPMGSKG
jgi:hypothetical protein